MPVQLLGRGKIEPAACAHRRIGAYSEAQESFC
jgi:hypothetical protein